MIVETSLGGEIWKPKEMEYDVEVETNPHWKEGSALEVRVDGVAVIYMMVSSIIDGCRVVAIQMPDNTTENDGVHLCEVRKGK